MLTRDGEPVLMASDHGIVLSGHVPALDNDPDVLVVEGHPRLLDPVVHAFLLS
jgi:hypothetical protein